MEQFKVEWTETRLSSKTSLAYLQKTGDGYTVEQQKNFSKITFYKLIQAQSCAKAVKKVEEYTLKEDFVLLGLQYELGESYWAVVWDINGSTKRLRLLDNGKTVDTTYIKQHIQTLTDFYALAEYGAVILEKVRGILTIKYREEDK